MNPSPAFLTVTAAQYQSSNNIQSMTKFTLVPDKPVKIAEYIEG